MVKQDQSIHTKLLNINSLFDTYAGMLFGYIFEVVKDRKTAEDCLVKTFSSIAEKFNETSWDEGNTWCRLQPFVKNELAAFYRATESSEAPTALPNVYLNEMTDEQRLVFCNIYYSKKTTAQLAAEMNKPETDIKQLLKTAFAVIRKLNGH